MLAVTANSPDGSTPDLPVFAADAPPQHLRGTLESVEGQTLSVKTAHGTDLINLADDLKVFLVSPADLSAIKDGKFVGVTSVEKAGKRVAVEVHVFDESLRGLGEGPLSLGSGQLAQHDDECEYRPGRIGWRGSRAEAGLQGRDAEHRGAALMRRSSNLLPQRPTS